MVLVCQIRPSRHLLAHQVLHHVWIRLVHLALPTDAYMVAEEGACRHVVGLHGGSHIRLPNVSYDVLTLLNLHLLIDPSLAWLHLVRVVIHCAICLAEISLANILMSKTLHRGVVVATGLKVLGLLQCGHCWRLVFILLSSTNRGVEPLLYCLVHHSYHSYTANSDDSKYCLCLPPSLTLHAWLLCFISK